MPKGGRGGEESFLLRTGSPRCRPRFRAAAAWREVEPDRGDGDGETSPLLLLLTLLDMAREGRTSGDEGGSEFRSGAIFRADTKKETKGVVQ